MLPPPSCCIFPDADWRHKLGRVRPSGLPIRHRDRRVRPVLAKYYIGDLADGEELEEELGLEDELAPGTFYAVLKQRVQDYMRANQVRCGSLRSHARAHSRAAMMWRAPNHGSTVLVRLVLEGRKASDAAQHPLLSCSNLRAVQLNPRTSTALFVKSALILATLVLSYYGTFFAFSSFAVRVFGSVLARRGRPFIGAAAPCQPSDAT